MKHQPTEPAFSPMSISLLLVAAISTLLSEADDCKSIWPVTDWICGIGLVALVVSLIYDARK